MSELHAAFAALHPPTLSRLDELLAYLRDNITPPENYERAVDLLRAVVDPGFSASLHDADAPPPEPPEPPPPEPPEPPPEQPPAPAASRSDVSRETPPRNGPPTPRNGTPAPRSSTRR